MIMRLLVNLRLNFPQESSRKTMTVCAMRGIRPKYIRYCTTVEKVWKLEAKFYSKSWPKN